MNGPPTRSDDVALFIDWENFKISLAAGHRTPNVSALKEEVSNHGRVVVAKAYADWVTRTPELRGAPQFINDPPALYAAGIEPVYVPTRLPGGDTHSQESNRRVRVKNSVDVKMTADCIEYAHSYPNIGTFVLVSGDSDFIHVINTLRAMGKRVVIIGVSWSTSRRLADQVDGLILYDTDVDPIMPPEPAPAPVSAGRATARDSGPSKRDLPQVISAIEEIIRTERQAGGTPLLTSIKQRLMRRLPGFDEKKVGFSGFKKLMLRVAQEGNIKVITTGLVDWAIMADEPDPTEALPDAHAEVPVASGQPYPPEGEVSQRPAQKSASMPSDTGLAAEFVGLQPAATGGDGASLAGADPSATLPGLELTDGVGDGRDAQRVADLIVMADTLESREDVGHVAFNFLVAEICQALNEGLKAEHQEIIQRWGQLNLRPYVTKMVRELSDGKLFIHGWQSWREQATGLKKRRRTLHLNRSHPVVQQTLADRLKLFGALPPKEGERAPAPAPDPAPEPAGGELLVQADNPT